MRLMFLEACGEAVQHYPEPFHIQRGHVHYQTIAGILLVPLGVERTLELLVT